MARKVFVSGGTGAIGRGIVERLANEGHTIHFSFCSSEAEARELESSLGATAHHIDYSTEWAPPISQADILINNAGINLSGHDVLATSQEEIEATLCVNFGAAMRLCQHFVPEMKARTWGRIVNVNSLYCLLRPRIRLSYTTSKFALRALTGTLAAELASSGITVNDVCPGPVDSQMLRTMGQLAVEAGRYGSLEEYLQGVGRDVPIGRLISPAEVAEAVAFLISDLAGACTGLSLRVDGGMGSGFE